MSQQELNQITTQLQDLSWGNTPTEMRANFTMGLSMPPHPTSHEDVVGVDGIAAELITHPNSRSDHIVLYLHGGKFIMGSLQDYRCLASYLAEAAGVSILVIDYRLAPEHPYPAELEDALTAYHWLINTRGFQSSQIAITGESAGGNLALGLLISQRSGRVTTCLRVFDLTLLRPNENWSNDG